MDEHERFLKNFKHKFKSWLFRGAADQSWISVKMFKIFSRWNLRVWRSCQNFSEAPPIRLKGEIFTENFDYFWNNWRHQISERLEDLLSTTSWFYRPRDYWWTLNKSLIIDNLLSVSLFWSDQLKQHRWCISFELFLFCDRLKNVNKLCLNTQTCNRDQQWLRLIMNPTVVSCVCASHRATVHSSPLTESRLL